MRRRPLLPWRSRKIAGRVVTVYLLLPPGLDTQLVVRPLLDKVEVKSYDSALRKIHFPHVRAPLLLYSVCRVSA